MDKTTIVLAVDSTQVNSAAAALQKMAGEGGKAESASAKLAAASTAQGKAITGSLVPAAAKAALGYKDIAAAAKELGPGATKQIEAALAATAAQANATAAAINNVNAAAANSGAATQPPGAANPYVSPIPRAPASGAPGPAGANAKQTSAGGDAAGKSAKQMDELGRSAKQVAMQHQIAAVQVKDFIEQVVAGGSPVRAFAMQGAAVVSNYGGFSNTLKSLGSLLTPVRLGIGGVATAVGALAVAYYEGVKQSKAFADAVILSGNFAGQTEGRINALAKSVADSTNSSIGSAREYANALISTGQIGPQVFSAATEAAIGYGKATGKTAQEVAADFAKMAQSPSKFAAAIDQSMNLFSSAERDAIKAMEENGRGADAQGLIYEKLAERLKGLDGNLGTIEKTLRFGKNAWSSFWDSALAIGRNETIEDRIRQLSQLAAGGGQTESGFGAAPAQSRTGQLRSGRAQLAAEELKGLNRRAFRQSENADAEAINKDDAKQADAGKTVVDGLLKRGKAASEYSKRLQELNRSIEANKRAGTPYSAADEAIARTELKKEFTDPKGASEAGQILKAQYDQQIKGFKDALDKEKDALAFHNQFQQGEYQAGRVALKDYYDDRIASIKDATAKEIAELDKERVATVTLIKKTKDPSEKVQAQTKLNEIDAQKEKLGVAGGREVEIATQEKSAAFKQLNEQVLNYRANLLQMQGDELGAAKVRADIAKDNAGILSRQSGGKISQADVDLQSALTEAANQFAEVQRRTGDLAQNTARAEEAANLVSELGSKSLLESENAIYTVRAKALEQLGELAAKAAELAKYSTDPKIKQTAADLALAYANAADKLDPALQRLRSMQKDIAAGITGTIDSGIANFGQNYLARRRQQQEDVLHGGKADSGAVSAVKTIGETIILPMAGQITASINKVLITDPLKQYIEGQMKKLTEDGGPFASFFKDALGIKDKAVDPKLAAEQAAARATDVLSNSLATQTTAVQASTDALNALTNAANGVAGVGGSKPLTVEPGATQASPSMGDFTRADRARSASVNVDGTQSEADSQAAAADSANALSKTALSAASDVSRLAQAAGESRDALGQLPNIISIIAAAAGGGGGGSSGGSAIGSLVGLALNAYAAYSGAGAIQVDTVASGAVSSNYNEMPNFLRGGRELGGPVSANSLYRVNEKGPEMLEMGGKQFLMTGLQGGNVISNAALTGKFKAPADDGSVSALLRSISGSNAKEAGESSASVLGGLLSRMGVKDESATAGALRVSGARELGGPVSAGKLYRVNERRPELLNVSGKQYLMMGNQGGKVDANPQAGAGHPPINVHINQSFAPGTDRTTTNQAAAQSGNAARRALTRMS